MIRYPNHEILSLDELQKWITSETAYRIEVVDAGGGLQRANNTAATLNQLRCFIREDIVRNYLIHHRILTVHDSICEVTINTTVVPGVYKLSFDYLHTDD